MTAPHTFIIVNSSQTTPRTYCFIATSQRERHDWVDNIKRLSYYLKVTSHAFNQALMLMLRAVDVSKFLRDLRDD